MIKKIKNNGNKKQKGATLLELLLYIGIVTIILVISGDLMMNIIFGKARSIAFEEVTANARISFNMLTTEIHNAQGINLVSGASSSSIALDVSDPLNNPLVFGVEDGMMWQKEGSAERVFLTTDNVTITDIDFQNVSFVGEKQAVRIHMTIESDIIYPRGNHKVLRDFYTTVY